MIEAFFVVWLGVLAAQLSPGPNLAAVASTALGDGRRPALFVVLGVAIGMFVWSFSTALGLAALLEQFPLSLVLLRFVGGAYLLWMAFKAAKSVVRNAPVAVSADAAGLTDAAAFRRGLFVLLTNPKAVMMWAAVSTFLFGAGLTPAQVLAFGPIGATSGLMVYGFYAWAFSTPAATRGYARAARGIEAVFAGAFGLLGGRLIWDGLKELKA
ncbi:Threonine efflux protein [Candidatus Rhodobacter oscarellae]|uniref:Threonine efflux protein n=1 Tax=Candidatus Rhodobacter oscarellae TaxID=1675527 RepID=A0A0J9H484_9RHOB|nr:LysE family translocator [Candidatus Rhodobacter lobularis]KMW60488.1 Threonine efflux protein [Candidatus Rhodobacter lobularis]